MSETDPAKIVVTLTNYKIMSLWVINKNWQRADNKSLGKITNNYSTSKCIQFIKKTFVHILLKKKNTNSQGTNILYWYIQNGYDRLQVRQNKVIKIPYTSVQKSKLYVILTVLLDYPESLNIITNSLYAKKSCFAYRDY